MKRANATQTVLAALCAGAAALALSGCGTNGPDNTLCSTRVAGDLVITEVLADPDGVDTGNEFVEIFNPGLTDIDLKGISIYSKKADGSSLKTHVIRNGTVRSKSYFTLGDIRGTDPLPPTIDYSYSDALGALQNSDGVVGLKCQSVVIDEASWATTKAGKSKSFDGKLTPSAVDNDDQSKWCEAKTIIVGTTNYGTPQQPNDLCDVTPLGGQCVDNGVSRMLVPPTAGALFITEVHARPKAVGSTVGEWFEVTATQAMDLNGLVLMSGTSKTALTSPDCIHLSSGEYATFAKETDPTLNGGVNNVKSKFTFSLVDQGSTLRITSADAGEEYDSATYPIALSGISWQLDPTKLNGVDNDDPGSFCRSTAIFGNGDYGTPGAANTDCALPVIDSGTPDAGKPDSGTPDSGTPAGTCLDSITLQQRAIVAPGVGDLVITELMPDPVKVGDAVGEYFEVVAKAAVDLNGLTATNDSAKTMKVSSPACIHLDPGAYAVFAASLDPGVNGGIMGAVAPFGSLTLNNTPPQTLTLRSGTTVVDAVKYSSLKPGISRQLKPTALDSVSNDDETNFCDTPATATYGSGDRGTPGTVNPACP